MIGAAFGQILGEARAGSEAAFAALYRELAPAVLGFARGRGAEDPEEVVAETMTSVARSLDRFRGDEAAFRSWTFTIAFRRLADDRRRAGRRVALRPWAEAEERGWAAGERGGVGGRGRSAGGFDGGAVSGPEEYVVERCVSEPIVAALRRLGADQRDVILLRVVGELSLREVAAVMGKGEGAVKMLQARGLDQLRAHLAGAAPGVPERATVGERDG
jgi:RNA polymerase sigma-70 factor (ECF subfamily)